MKKEIPDTLGWSVEKAMQMLKDYTVVIEETSTPFEDKKEERRQNTPIVVRQVEREEDIFLTVARFK